MKMKLKLLVVAAGLMALPAMGSAQTPTDTTMKMGKDTMMKMGKDTMKTMSGMKTTTAKKTAARKRAAKAEAKESAVTEHAENVAATTTPTGTLPDQSVNGPRPVPPSDGTTCPWKCPTSKGTAGLTGPQFLALQQELRDKGCGTSHVTGWLDSPTRHAVGVCAKKLGVANNAGAVLVAMNIGYGASDVSTGKM
jgi:hypothetical protein